MWNSNIFATSKKSIFFTNKFGNIGNNYTSPYERFCSEEERDVLRDLSASNNTESSHNSSDAILDALSPCDTLHRAKSRKTFYDKISVKEKKSRIEVDKNSDSNSIRSELKYSNSSLSSSFRISLSPYERYQIVQKMNKTPMSFENFLKRTYPIPVPRSKNVIRRHRDVPGGLWV